MHDVTRVLFVGLFGGLVFASGCRDKPAYRGAVDLSGEWAIEWEDKSKNYRETFYLWLQHRDGKVSGDALDPALTPAIVAGEIAQGKVNLVVTPQPQGGWASTPPSTFKGTMTGPDAMEGRYRVPGQRGPWKAWRTNPTGKRSVTVTAKTKVAVELTAREYDIVYHPLAVLTPNDAVYRPLDKYDLEAKEHWRSGDAYRVEKQIGELGGWLYELRMLAERAGYGAALNENQEIERIRSKIIQALNQSGYPWQAYP